MTSSHHFLQKWSWICSFDSFYTTEDISNYYYNLPPPPLFFLFLLSLYENYRFIYTQELLLFEHHTYSHSPKLWEHPQLFSQTLLPGFAFQVPSWGIVYTMKQNSITSPCLPYSDWTTYSLQTLDSFVHLRAVYYTHHQSGQSFGPTLYYPRAPSYGPTLCVQHTEEHHLHITVVTYPLLLL